MRAAQWQMAVSAKLGVPEKLCNTYDILSPQKYDQVSYNSVFHLAAMKAAAAALARAVGNATFAALCDAAHARGAAALDARQWVAANASEAHYSFHDGDDASLMVDSLYAQVLAYSAGLGRVVSSDDKVTAHLRTEELWADTEHGLIVSTNGYGGGGSPNWATLNIHHGMPVAEALRQPE
eukprot:gene5159-3964_t